MTLPAATLDHVVINARDDMDRAADIYRRLGFTLTERGYHSLGSINHLAMFGTDYLELIAVPKGATTGRMDLLNFPFGLNGLVFGEPHGQQRSRQRVQLADDVEHPDRGAVVDDVEPDDLPDVRPVTGWFGVHACPLLEGGSCTSFREPYGSGRRLHRSGGVAQRREV